MKMKIFLFMIIAALLAIIPVYVGLTHNPMGEFCLNGNLDNCKFDWLYIFQLWLWWFFAVAIAQIIAVFLVKLLKLLTKDPKGM